MVTELDLREDEGPICELCIRVRRRTCLIRDLNPDCTPPLPSDKCPLVIEAICERCLREGKRPCVILERGLPLPAATGCPRYEAHRTTSSDDPTPRELRSWS